MLTPQQIEYIQEYLYTLLDETQEYIIKDIVRRIVKTGDFTRTAQFRSYMLTTMGKHHISIEKEISRLTGIAYEELNNLFDRVGELSYIQSAKVLSNEYLTYEDNTAIQNIVKYAKSLGLDNFKNLTQSMGMVTQSGDNLPLKEAYNTILNKAFLQTTVGGVNTNTAIKEATKQLVNYGITQVDYTSGITRNIDTAVRGAMLGSLGLMVEQIQQENIKTFGADGVEISAHFNSALDHEPFQGKQYTLREYEFINSNLKRRISTLNCKHIAFPINIGISQPAHSKEELQKMKEDNKKGVIYKGKKYTGYEATQYQRYLERQLRYWKRKKLVSDITEIEKIQSNAKLNLWRNEYTKFSNVANLRKQNQRLTA